MCFFRSHKWKVLSENTLPSPIQQIKGCDTIENIPSWFFRVMLVQTFQCERCKSIKTIRSTNP